MTTITAADIHRNRIVFLSAFGLFLIVLVGVIAVTLPATR